MDKFSFFDCDASFGKRTIVRKHTPCSREELCTLMEHYGIGAALVRHAYAEESDPIAGNEILVDAIKDEPRLFPVWVVLPHHAGDFYTPDVLAAKMRESNVRAVTFPAGNWTIGEWTCGELFSMLEEYRIPVLLNLGRLEGAYAGLNEILSAHPRLRVILKGATYRAVRDVYPLLERFEGLHISTATYKALDGIEDVVRRFGAKRLIYGSGLPEMSGATSVAMITYAKLSDAEKQMIASENLKTLLGGVLL